MTRAENKREATHQRKSETIMTKTDNDNGYTHSNPLPKRAKWSAATIFTYCDEHGAAVFQVHRQTAYLGSKHRPVIDEKTGKPKKNVFQVWLTTSDRKKPKNAPVLPYRMPELIEAVADGQIIFITEGEPKVDALCEWGLAATCCAEGVGKWKAEHAEFLRGADVIILPDNDSHGRWHADQVGHSLEKVAARRRLLELPGLSDKGDIIDWIAAGGDARTV